MNTRTALGLAVLLLVLFVAQRVLLSLGASAPSVPVTPTPVSPNVTVVEPETALDAEPEGEVLEPVIDIPEYVPEPVTERPRPQMGFEQPEFRVELGAPEIVGAVEGSEADATDQ